MKPMAFSSVVSAWPRTTIAPMRTMPWMKLLPDISGRVQDHRHPRDDDVPGDRREHEDVERYETIHVSVLLRVLSRIITAGP